LAESWTEFRKGFFSHGNNYKKMPLLFNPLLQRSRIDALPLNFAFFAQNPPLSINEIRSLKFEDFVSTNRRIIPYERFHRNTDIELSPASFLRIANSCLHYVDKLDNDTGTDSSTTICSLWKKNKKDRNFIVDFLQRSTIKPSISKYVCMEKWQIFYPPKIA